MWPGMGRAALATIVAGTLVLAGCGGDEQESEPEPPSLPADLATALSVESDRIGESLAAGRECAAHRQAQALRAHVGDAIGRGDVPPALARQMSAAASSLSDGIVCEPAPPPAPEPEVEQQPADPCEQLADQFDQLTEQAEEGDPALREQLEEQARALGEQLRFQCEEHLGGGDEEDGFVPPGQDDGFVPPGQQGDGPGNSGNGGGGGDGD
jgi:hypothetical protein